jgi:hypothetical protein
MPLYSALATTPFFLSSSPPLIYSATTELFYFRQEKRCVTFGNDDDVAKETEIKKASSTNKADSSI